MPDPIPGPIPDPIFGEQRLARLYDAFDADRSDLEAYVAIVAELGADSVLDVGCGTGVLGCLLAALGVDVVGVDPAAASLEVARGRPGGDAVRWLDGDATTLPPLQVDLAVMTANVAQVFLTHADWVATLTGVHAALRPGGHLVLETRVPARRAWEEWTPELTRTRVDVPGEGLVERWCEVLDVSLPFVTFRWTTVFDSDGTTAVSDSTLVFREPEDLAADLAATGFVVVDIREAPDRPGKEHVFVARRDGLSRG